MKVLIVHISDIHFKETGDPVTARLSKIVGALRSFEYPFDCCLVLVSGDVAFSGKQNQYLVALEFFATLKDEIERLQPDLMVGFAFVPGNHDCDFGLLDIDIHEAVINSVTSKLGSLNMGDGLVQKLLALQEEFFKFESQIMNSTAPVESDSRFMYSKAWSVGGQNIRVNCYNTAWISRLHEMQGAILFPLQILNTVELGGRENQLVISMFHHPFGWFRTDNSIAFERLIEGSSDVILTGHEHVEKYSVIRDSLGQEVNYSKGSVLQEHGEPETSGFNLIFIDTDARKQKIIHYKWKDNKYSRQSQTELLDFIRNKSLKGGLFELSNEFVNELNDAGASFDHPRLDRLLLRDVFVYPDLQDKTFVLDSGGTKLRQKTIRGQEILEYINTHKRVLITGADVSGKTTLAKVLCYELKHVVPVLVHASELDGPDLTQFKRSIATIFKREYSETSLEDFEQLEKERRALIIDDFHKSKFRSRRSQNKLLEVISQEFGTVVVFADEIFHLQELAAYSPENDPLGTFRSLTISELGYVLRGQLIKRWIRLGQEHVDDKELMLTINNYAKVILHALGKNILPSYPLVILTILQTWEATQGHDMQAGSYGHIYDELITRALRRASGDPEDLDIKYTFVSRLAYRMFASKRSNFNYEEVREVQREYFRLFAVDFPLERMLQELEAARMLKAADGNYQFKYKYVYYYFVARYFKETIVVPEETSELQNRLFEMADRVHNEEYANILAFYVYRTKDQSIIERLVMNANRIYDEFPPCDFEEHVEFLNQRYSSLPILELPPADPEKNQESHWQQLDEAEEPPSDQSEEAYGDVDYDSGLSDLMKLNMALKSLQVIGQILRNSPGSIRGNIKLDITRAGYRLGLRVLGAMLSLVESNLDELRNQYAKMIGEKRAVKSRDELVRLADGVLMDLTQSMAYGMIKLVSQALGHEKLSAVYAEVLREENNTATRLIDLSVRLDNFRGVPEAAVFDLQKEFHHNMFGLSVLRDLIANYLYLFPVEERMRQRLSQAFDIKLTDPTMLIGRDKRLLRATEQSSR